MPPSSRCPRRWAHLDIAGPPPGGGDDGGITKGGTGVGTRLLLHWLTAAAFNSPDNQHHRPALATAAAMARCRAPS